MADTGRSGEPAPSARGRAAAWACILAAALTLPFLLKDFHVFQLTLMLIYAIAILGLNIQTGFNGKISLGHSAFYANGAYPCAILIEHGGIAYYWSVPLAGLASFCFGFLFGFPALRLRGIYLALATFSLAVATPPLLKFPGLDRWTGGAQGMTVTRPDAPFGLPLSADRWLYLVTLAVTVILFAGAYNLVASRSGRAIVAIRDNAVAASASGIDVTLFKTLTFGVSAFYTGIAGALSALAVQFVAPDSFTFTLAIALFVGLVVGGVGSIGGTLAGGAFILFVPNIAEQFSKGLAGAVYGVILILVIYAMPSGAAGLASRIASRVRRSGSIDHKERTR
jgi:branched-chain amino acid transport system permease protein